MRVGILDILADASFGGVAARLYGPYFRKQYMSIMPQAIAAWCRSSGHHVHYATFWGQSDPLALLPDELDVVFIAAYTQCSALAYALGTIFRRRGSLTVIGGPHAKSFPTDCARFFDIVVKDCDQTLIDDILHRRFDPPAIVSSGRPLTEFPSVEERMPEIKIASFHKGRPLLTSIVPVLSSIGCPYTCDFCMDWNSQYVALAPDRLYADLDYLSRHYPRLVVGYHDPNFAIRFDATMDVISRVPEGRRNPYIMESSFSVLKEDRLARLRETNCVYVAPGVESWTDYSNKSGTSKQQSGRDKLEKIVAHIDVLSRFVPGIQANFLLGSDSDRGDEPVSLTREFIERLPEVWPTINIPTPYGGTPLYDELYRSGRILAALPFSLYYTPYLAITLKHYDPVTYYQHLIDLYRAASSMPMLVRRLRTKSPRPVRFVHALRTASLRADVGDFRRIRGMLVSDRGFRAFHEGRSDVLPPFYSALYEKRLGRFAELLPPALRRPVLEPPAPPVHRKKPAVANAVAEARVAAG